MDPYPWLERDRSIDFNLEIPENDLYDFQKNAVIEAVKYLNQCPNIYCLALDSGCGKTRTAQRIIENCGAKMVLVITPNGLEKQFSSELSRHAPSNFFYHVLLHDSPSKQDLSSKNTHVLIMCKKVWSQRCFPRIDLVIVDEAHLYSSFFLKTLSAKNHKVLLLTATPTIMMCKMIEKMGGRSENIFVFKKTPQVLDKLQLRTVSVEPEPLFKSEQEINIYWEKLHTSFRSFAWFPSTILALLEWSYHKPCHQRLTRCLESDINSSQRLSFDQSFKHRSQGLRRFAQRKLGSRIKQLRSFDIPAEMKDFIEESILIETEHADYGFCECCGMNSRELKMLQNEHNGILPGTMTSGLTDPSMTRQRILICGSTQRQLKRLIRTLSLNRCWVRMLTSKVPQKVRHEIIEEFCSKDTMSVNISVLSRGLRNSSCKSARGIGNLDSSAFANILSAFLIPTKLLFLSSEFELGINLHRFSTSVVLPVVPDSTPYLARMCNRMSRLCFDIDSEKTLPIRILIKRKTLDHLFLYHIFHSEPKMTTHVPVFAGMDRDTFDEISEELQRHIPASEQLAIAFLKKVLASRRPLSKFKVHTR